MDTRVLVVEDDAEINELLGEYLSLENIKYIQALNGATAIQDALGSHPDAIVLDLMLPDIDGFQVANEVASHRGTYDIPIIMLTCMNQEHDRQRGIASGAYRFMNKPFLPDDLLASIRAALEWRKSLSVRPCTGRIEISPSNPCEYHQAINEMIRDLFSRTKLSDAAVGQVRTGFGKLTDWVTQWAKHQQCECRLIVEYRITDADGRLSSDGQAAAIHWQIWEPKPGLLDQMIFKAQTPSASLTVNSNMEPIPAGELAKWYEFLAQCGVARLEKDTKQSRIRLERRLADARPTMVPLVVIDGVRMPTRVREEMVPRT